MAEHRKSAVQINRQMLLIFEMFLPANVKQLVVTRFVCTKVTISLIVLG